MYVAFKFFYSTKLNDFVHAIHFSNALVIFLFDNIHNVTCGMASHKIYTHTE